MISCNIEHLYKKRKQAVVVNQCMGRNKIGDVCIEHFKCVDNILHLKLCEFLKILRIGTKKYASL